MNASIRGVMFVKADRINQRVDDIAKLFLNLGKNKKSISRDGFNDFVKSVHLIVDTELNEKGVERKWKA